MPAIITPPFTEETARLKVHWPRIFGTRESRARRPRLHGKR